jgi:hypothetical protein
MKKLFAIQIFLLIIFSVTLGGLLVFTDIYNDVKSNIVEQTCFSCLKLDRIASLDFTFDTVDGRSHPDFILDNLTKGPVFIVYGSNSCSACKITDSVIKQTLNLDYDDQELLFEIIDFEGYNVGFFHINVDEHHGEFLESFYTYDKDRQNGVPMFVIITFGNNSGVIEPCYTTAYGTLGSSHGERRDFIINMIDLGLDKYLRFF